MSVFKLKENNNNWIWMRGKKEKIALILSNEPKAMYKK